MIKVYDLNMGWVAVLENAFAIGYETPFNAVWSASFSLPADDPKNAECQAFRYVEIFNGDDRVDLFRILPDELHRSDGGKTINYQCEHVLATLLDDVLFQYNQIGNLGVYTTAVLQFILGKQLTSRWKIGTVAFTHQFEYKWENDNLLSALFSVPKPFVEAYQWTWDTTSYPWTLNLVAADMIESARIRYGYNLRGIKRKSDPTNLCTRMYGLGYGEGVNQLTIAEVNGGVPYLNTDTQMQFGIITRVFSDRRFESAATLKARMLALLEELKVPRMTYQVDAAELYQLTGDTVDRFIEGALVRVIDEDLGIDIISRVVNVRRPDIKKEPWNAQIEIGNRPLDIAGSISQLEDRQRINDVYSQGATNLDSHDFADNADPTHPATIRFYIPAETVRINKMALSYEVSQFRAYSKSLSLAAQSVGTTTSGGATTSGSSSTSTTASGGGTTSGSSSTSTTASGGGIVGTNTSVQILATGTSIDYTAPGGTDGHTHNLYNHGHQVDIPAHTHNMDHTHTIGSHTHNMDHTHTIGSHTHDITIPAHTHDIQYGIFLRDPAPQHVTVLVDGSPVSGLTGVNASDVDIIPYLSKGTDGKVNRGSWHEIKITPDDLGRINVNVVTQLFVQSRGGGNY